MSRDKIIEITKYFFFGVLTTIVNYICYFVSTKILCIYYLLSNIIAWFISVTFAFVVNKKYVFNSSDYTLKKVIKEVTSFISARIFSGLLETLLLFVFVSLLGWNDSIIKLISSVFVVIINYFFSKYLIFNHK